MKTLKVLAGLGILMGLLPSGSWAAEEVSSQEICTVTSDRDINQKDNGKMTFRYALNKSGYDVDPNRRLCKEGINLDVARIGFEGTVVIYLPGNNVPYTIKGISESGPTLFDFKGLAASAPRPADPLKRCVITFYATSNVIFENISVSGNVGSGICLGSERDNLPVTNIQFKNVDVEGMEGNGFVFFPGAKLNTIDPFSSVVGVTGAAVARYSSEEGSQNYNTIEPTSLNISDWSNSELDADGDGLLDQERLYERTYAKLILKAIGSENFVTSVRPASLRVDLIQKIQDQFKVIGRVVETTNREEICSAETVTNLVRLEIYSASPGKHEGEFLTYVLPRSDTDTNGNGVWEKGSKQGEFRFMFSSVDEWSDVRQIALVPVFANGSTGGNGALVELSEDRNPSGCEVTDETPTGGVGEVTRFVAPSVAQAQCLEERGTDGFGRPVGGAPVSDTADSDGDGLVDALEDSNQNCQCDNDDISCWYKVDTDQDGITDGDEIRVDISDIKRLFDNGGQSVERSATGFCGALTTDPCDSDHDHLSNANEKDSDDDGKQDYEEDRESRTYSLSNKGYYVYYRGRDLHRDEVKDADGNNVECTLQDNRIGLEWGLYMVTSGNGGNVTDVQPWNQETAAGNGQRIKILGCKSEKIKFDTELNGKFDSSDSSSETSLTSLDTDDDGICDGNGTCGRLSVKGDKCPLVDNVPSTDPNACTLNCINGEVLRNVDPNLRDGADGGLKKDATGQYLLFATPDGVTETAETRAERIKNQCNSDLDNDQIPDCVELPTGYCQDLQTNAGQYLNPYEANSDKREGDDAVNDAFDVDPFVAAIGSIDSLSESDFAAKRRLFIDKPIGTTLMLFIDRDGDGLKDAQEDKDMNGEFNQNQKGLAAALAGLAESDPLKKNSDEDDLDDKKEWERKTNPQDKDTDQDGLIDSREAKSTNESERDQIQSSLQGCRLYPVAEELETSALDPDSDGDGIFDGVEVGADVTDRSLLIDGSIENRLQGIFPTEGFRIVSNPLNANSDGDSIPDGEEIGSDGVLKYGETNPCASDTDGDGLDDNVASEAGACALIPSLNCKSSEALGFPDVDSDGSPDQLEDTDRDGFYDAPGSAECATGLEEGCDFSDFMNRDTDGDGLLDSDELSAYGRYRY